MNIISKTGNTIVDEISTMNLTGNIIPESWYKTIVNENKKTNLLAIVILSEIVYWYRPTEVRDENTNNVTYKKKFHDKDYVQKNYAQLCDKYNISEKQARSALILLENLGVVKRHFRNIEVGHYKLHNVMYLELIPTKLKELTFIDVSIPDTEIDGSQKVNTSFPKAEQVLPLEEPSTDKVVNTYTETTSENGTNTTTTSAVVELLKPLSLKNKDIETIINVSNGDIKIIENAVNYLKQYKKPIKSVVGFLISAINYNYENHQYQNNNNMHGFSPRDYDYVELEKALLAN